VIGSEILVDCYGTDHLYTLAWSSPEHETVCEFASSHNVFVFFNTRRVHDACVRAGITINQYQVDRATHHNDRLGVSPLADVVRGNFCEMPFPPNSFDAAYAIEATCHGE
jgi:hypothetical protein